MSVAFNALSALWALGECIKVTNGLLKICDVGTSQGGRTSIRMSLVEVGVPIQFANQALVVSLRLKHDEPSPPREAIRHWVVSQKLREQRSQQCAPKRLATTCQ